METMEIKTEIIKKPKKLITVQGQMGIRERQIYNVLLQLIETQKTDKEGYFLTNIAHISKQTNIKDYKELENVLLNLLPYTKLKIDLLNKNEEKIRIIQLIGEIEIYNKNEVKLFFTPTIIKMVKNKNYTKLEMEVLSKLNSKFSLAMYEIIKRYYVSNVNYYQIPQMELKQFRELMGVKDNQYTRIADFKRKILEQIKKDINLKTGFNLDYELFKKNSRSYNYIKFSFSKKTPKKVKSSEEKIKNLEKELSISETRTNNQEKLISNLSNSIYQNQALVNSAINDSDILSQENEKLEQQKINSKQEIATLKQELEELKKLLLKQN